MITLDSVLKSLEIKLAGAATTTELPFVASYADLSQTTFALTGAGEQDGVTTGSTAVEVVAAPGASTSRKLNFLSVVNVDTAVAVLTVQVNNNATKRIVFKITLAVGDQLYYTDAGGFVIFDSSGNQKTTMQIPPLTVTNAMLAGSIAASKLIGTDIATVGTITAGVWNAGALTTSGVLTVNGFGTHGFIVGGVGEQHLSVRNSTAGTANLAKITASADGGTSDLELTQLSSTYTTSGVRTQDGGLLLERQAGGLSIAAQHASGVIRFYAGGTTLRAQIQTTGTQTWAPYGAGAATFDASGNITSVSDVRFKDRIAPLPYGLAEVVALNPVQHGYNALSELDREHLYGGFLAHEVARLIPIAVGQDARGYLTLADRPILGAVVNAVKEIATRLHALEHRHG